jgi:phytoene dehydrogenase-like protein
VGGVVRTNAVDGFRIDRGFQVLLTGYPEVRCMLDLPALRPGRFHPGALVWAGGRLRRVGDPLRRPLDAPATLASGLVTPGDAVRVLALRARLARRPLEAILTAAARPTHEALARRGFSRRFIDGFLRPFLRGVFLEPELATSSRFFEFVFRTFSVGDATLPAEGMEAVPRQLAARLAEGTLRLGAPVRAVAGDGVVLDSGERLPAAAVVVACDGAEAARLVPAVRAPAWNGTVALAFDAPAPPVRGPWLVLNADDPGPVHHLCVPSEVTSGYAPEGRTLVQASVVGAPEEDDEALAQRAREQMTRWFGPAVAPWRLLRVDRIPWALPRQTPDRFDPVTRTVDFGEGLFVCGAHRETASLGGALRSGRRAARAVARRLGLEPRIQG